MVMPNTNGIAFISDRRICVDERRERLVDCDSPDAYFQIANAGGPVMSDDARRYGLTPPVAAAEPAPAADQSVTEAADESSDPLVKGALDAVQEYQAEHGEQTAQGEKAKRGPAENKAHRPAGRE